MCRDVKVSQLSLTIGETTFDHIRYDVQADVLYLSAGAPRHADRTIGTAEGHAVRFDQQHVVIGITPVGVAALAASSDPAITIPRVVRIERSQLEKALAIPTERD